MDLALTKKNSVQNIPRVPKEQEQNPTEKTLSMRFSEMINEHSPFGQLSPRLGENHEQREPVVSKASNKSSNRRIEGVPSLKQNSPQKAV